jgi:hypothetical protein
MMSVMFLAAMMMAQTTAQPQPLPQQPAAQQTAAKKQKPKQICEYIEVTGSRSKRRVCKDESGNLDLGPGIHSGTSGAAGGQTLNTGSPGGSN